MKTSLCVAVEGSLDEQVVLRLLQVVGKGEVKPVVYVKHGKTRLLQKINGYNAAAERVPWFVLVDLNSDAPCAPDFVQRVLPRRTRFMCFRVAVRAVEAWLMADRQNLARFLGIPPSRIPLDPEQVEHPKKFLLQLVRRFSRRKGIRQDLLPAPETGASEGPLYVSRMREFVDQHWDPENARQHAESLDRAIRCLDALLRG